MCTRFYIKAETEELKEILSEVQRSRLAGRFLHAGYAIITAGAIRPSQVVPVLAPAKDGRKAVFPMKWGFQLPGRPLLVNARSETAAQKETFREAWERHRCAIPASWYYEWEHITDHAGHRKAGDRYLIQPRGQAVTWLAGLYRIEDGLPVFAVLTREPSCAVRQLHDRMPFILPAETVDGWLNPNSDPQGFLTYALSDMMIEKTV